jgi:hypothetical protein
MGFFPCSLSSSLQREKWPHPRNPRCAESGDGCVDMSKWCRFCVQQKIQPHQLRTLPTIFLQLIWRHIHHQQLIQNTKITKQTGL